MTQWTSKNCSDKYSVTGTKTGNRKRQVSKIFRLRDLRAALQTLLKKARLPIKNYYKRFLTLSELKFQTSVGVFVVDRH